MGSELEIYLTRSDVHCESGLLPQHALFDFKFILNFVFFEMVCLVWKTGSRFVQFFKKVNGCDYSQLFSTLL